MTEILYMKTNNGLVPANQKALEQHNQIQNNSVVVCNTKGSYEHDLTLHNKFWRCCQLFCENTNSEDFPNKDVVCERLKIALNYIEYTTKIKRKKEDGTTEEIIHEVSKSLEFSKADPKEASNFKNQAIDVMAGALKVSRQDFINNAMMNYAVTELQDKFKGEVLNR